MKMILKNDPNIIQTGVKKRPFRHSCTSRGPYRSWVYIYKYLDTKNDNYFGFKVTPVGKIFPLNNEQVIEFLNN